MTSSWPVAALVGLAALLGGCAEGTGPQRDAPASTAGAATSGGISVPAGAEQLENTFGRVIERVLPSVVEIRTAQGLGSGVVFDTQGNIVTNAHVVADSPRLEVHVAGRSTPVAARLVGSYPPDDLAVIRVADPQGARPATFARSGEVAVGDLVLALGNPLGLSNSVTNGIVSAVGRTVIEPGQDGRPGTTIPNTIQTSANVNPGNSGGALANLRAQVIGIPTLTAVSPQTGAQAPGIGFAISADTVLRIVPQLIAKGEVTDSGRASLGLRVTTVTDGSGSPVGVGVVDVVEGGPAARAGIRVGDIITAVADRPTDTVRELSTVLSEQQVGERVPVRFNRDGSQRTVTAVLGIL